MYTRIYAYIHGSLGLGGVTLGRDGHERLRHLGREGEEGCYPRGGCAGVLQ